MVQDRARPLSNQNTREIAIGIFHGGEQTPVEVIRESVPAGFPPELLHYLADFLAKGFNAACSRQPGQMPSLAEFALSTRGRPIDDEAEREGQEAFKLHKQNPKLSWQKIALKVCRKRKQSGHHCGKKCADRVRQATNSYEDRKELEHLARGET